MSPRRGAAAPPAFPTQGQGPQTPTGASRPQDLLARFMSLSHSIIMSYGHKTCLENIEKFMFTWPKTAFPNHAKIRILAVPKSCVSTIIVVRRSPVARSVARSLGRSLARSITRSLDRSLARSLVRSLTCALFKANTKETTKGAARQKAARPP